jgi:DNA primase
MSYDADRFKELVKERADLLGWIIRDGVALKGGGTEYKGLCPFHKEKTPSFTVFKKDGSWGYFCYGCSAGGDVFSYVQARRQLAFPHALKLLANELGLSVPDDRLYQPPQVREAVEQAASAGWPVDRSVVRGVFDPSKFEPLDEGGKAGRYLIEKRKLTMEVLARYHVGQTVGGEAYTFAYKWRPEGAKNDRFEFCKVVKVDRLNGKKEEFRDPKGGRNILFGMTSVDPEATRLVICEGEIDAMTWAQMGVAAVSVPGGAGYLGWIEVCWDWLARFTNIHISFDEDRAGRAKVVEVVTRLGMARTDMVRLPERVAETN